MKAIVVLALFFLAANATMNFTAYNLGIARKFNLTNTQIKNDVLPCGAALNSTAQSLLDLFTTKPDVENIVVSLVEIYAEAQQTLKVTCLPYANDIATILVQYVNLTEIKEVMKANFATYYPFVVQQADILITSFLTGKYFQAGQTDAYIGQILLGITQPQALPVPQFNMSNYVPLNQTTFINEFYSSFFSALGVSNVNTEEMNQCATQVETIIANIKEITSDFDQLSLSEKLDVVRHIAEYVLEGAFSCEYSVELYVKFAAPVFEAFKKDPLTFILKGLNNYALNLPQITQLGQTMAVQVFQGQYAVAAQTEAEIVKIIYTGLINDW